MIGECPNCRRSFQKKVGQQKYCGDACKREVARINQRRWVAAHPQKKLEHGRKSARLSNERRREYISTVEDESREAIWFMNEPPELIWYVLIKIPYNPSFSKNGMYIRGKGGRVAYSDGARTARDELTIRIRNAFQNTDIQPVPAKVWIDILVRKQEARGDAINFVDVICDAIKDGIGVDDRWFSIRRLDWIVSRNPPIIHIGIGQETSESHKICSVCKRILPTKDFPSNKARSGELHTFCIECREMGKVKR